MPEADPRYRGLTWPVILPVFEVVRARIPYPVWVFLFYAPFGFAAGWMNNLVRLGQGGSLWVMPSLGVGVVLAIAVLLGILDAIGRASGYRPFVHRWEGVVSATADREIERIAESARQRGFEIVWCKQAKGFVAVRSTNLEQNVVNSGQAFPIRLSLFIQETDLAHCQLVMKLQNRTVVFWDTGESQTLANVGAWIVQGAAEPLPVPAPLPGRVAP